MDLRCLHHSRSRTKKAHTKSRLLYHLPTSVRLEVFLFCLSARLFAQGGTLTSKCQEVWSLEKSKPEEIYLSSGNIMEYYIIYIYILVCTFLEIWRYVLPMSLCRIGGNREGPARECKRPRRFGGLSLHQSARVQQGRLCFVTPVLGALYPGQSSGLHSRWSPNYHGWIFETDGNFSDFWIWCSGSVGQDAVVSGREAST